MSNHTRIPREGRRITRDASRPAGDGEVAGSEGTARAGDRAVAAGDVSLAPVEGTVAAGDQTSATGESIGALTDGISRRELLQVGVGATLAAPIASALTTGAASLATPATAAAATTPLFFTAAELGVLDELTEMILPTDEHSGGARAAGVAEYLDRTLAEKDPAIGDYAAERLRFKQGLLRVDQLAFEMHGGAFMEVSPEQRLAVLDRIAKNEEDPKLPEERFFGELKTATTRAYYSSRIGMIDEMEYKGNRVIREFVGADVSKP